jgi:hypothetical protein
MIQSKSKQWSLIPNKDLFILKLDNPREGIEQICLEFDELAELKEFLNEIPLPVKDKSLDV